MTELTKEYLDKIIKKLPTKTDVEDIVFEKTKNFATKKDVETIVVEKTKNFATKDDLKGFATKDDLKNFATKNDIDNAVDDLAGIVLKTVVEPMNQRFDKLEEKINTNGQQITAFEEKFKKLEDVLNVKL